MSESGAIEPSAVYSPGHPITTGRQKFYDTYNTTYLNDDPLGGQGGGGGGGGGGGFNYQGGLLHRTMQRVPNGSGPVVSLPNGLPKFLGARSVIFFAWMAAMAMVSLDEWHTNHILPRPARLWYTSLLFFLLAMVSTIDIMVPITNLFALGMVIVLGYQYYQGTGQFGQTGATEATSGAADVEETVGPALGSSSTTAPVPSRGSEPGITQGVGS